MSTFCREICIALNIPFSQLPVLLLMDRHDDQHSIYKVGQNLLEDLGNIYYDYYENNKEYFETWDFREMVLKKISTAKRRRYELEQNRTSANQLLELSHKAESASAIEILNNQSEYSFPSIRQLVPLLEEKKYRLFSNCTVSEVEEKVNVLESILGNLKESSDFIKISNLFRSFSKKSRRLPHLHLRVIDRVDERLTATKTNDAYAVSKEIEYLGKNLLNWKSLALDFINLPLSHNRQLMTEAAVIESDVSNQNQQLLEIAGDVENSKSALESLMAEERKLGSTLDEIEYKPLTKYGTYQEHRLKMKKYDEITRTLFDHPVSKLVIDISKKLFLK